MAAWLMVLPLGVVCEIGLGGRTRVPPTAALAVPSNEAVESSARSMAAPAPAVSLPAPSRATPPPAAPVVQKAIERRSAIYEPVQTFEEAEQAWRGDGEDGASTQTMSQRIASLLDGIDGGATTRFEAKCGSSLCRLQLHTDEPATLLRLRALATGAAQPLFRTDDDGTGPLLTAYITKASLEPTQ